MLVPLAIVLLLRSLAAPNLEERGDGQVMEHLLECSARVPGNFMSIPARSPPHCRKSRSGSILFKTTHNQPTRRGGPTDNQPGEPSQKNGRASRSISRPRLAPHGPRPDTLRWTQPLACLEAGWPTPLPPGSLGAGCGWGPYRWRGHSRTWGTGTLYPGPG